MQMPIVRYAEGLALSSERLQTLVYAYESAQKILRIPNGDAAANDALALVIVEIAKTGEISPEGITRRAIQTLATRIEPTQSYTGL